MTKEKSSKLLPVNLSAKRLALSTLLGGMAGVALQYFTGIGTPVGQAAIGSTIAAGLYSNYVVWRSYFQSVGPDKNNEISPPTSNA